MTRSPITRVGGKFYLAKKIIENFPAHKKYIEPFGGAMHVLFRKEPSPCEVYNDIESGLVNFFQVVKHQPEELFKRLGFSLYSREVFYYALNNMNTGSPVERAYNFYIVNRQCFGGKMKTWGIGGDCAIKFSNYEMRIREAHKRLKTVFIENMDFRELIPRYDGKDSLFYLDPPYMFNGSRTMSKCYDNEMTDADHAELVELLKTVKGKFILSGYENGLYDCFKRVNIGTVNMCVNKVDGGKRVQRQEFIWRNF